MERTTRVVGSLLLAGALALTAGCSRAPLTVGVSYDRPGLGLRVLHDFSGIDTVLARDLARRLGHPGKKDVTLVNVPERRTVLADGNLPYDLLVAAYPATGRLKDRADLVGPYLRGRQDIAVRAEDTQDVGPRSLSGRLVCVVAGSQVGEAAPRTFPGARIAYRSTLSTCLTELRRGTVDAVSDEGLALRGYAAEAPFKGSVRVVGADFPEVDYYLAVSREDPALCGKVRAALQAAIDDGTWARAYEEQLVRTGAVPSVPAPPRVSGCS